MCTYVNKLKCFYTNTNTLLNKHLELSALIHEHRYHTNNQNVDQKNQDMDPETQYWRKVTPLHEKHKASDGQTHPQIKITYAKWDKTTNLHDSKG